MDYLLHIATLYCIYLLLAQSMNLYLGKAGILALCHIAFYGIGAYTSALITLNGGGFGTGILAGMLLTALLGISLGLVGIKLRADYLGIVTLGFAQIMSTVFQSWNSVTRGPLGLPGIPRPEFFGVLFNEKWAYFLLVAALTTLGMGILYRLMKSPYGRVLEMIRDDEIAARTLGKNVLGYKLSAFAIGAGIAALAGSLNAHLVQYISPQSFLLDDLSTVLVMTILGGLGTFRGPFLGVFIILLLREGVTFIPNLPPQTIGGTQLLLYSLLFLVAMIYFPQGLGGTWKTRRRHKKQFTTY